MSIRLILVGVAVLMASACTTEPVSRSTAPVETTVATTTAAEPTTTAPGTTSIESTVTTVPESPTTTRAVGDTTLSLQLVADGFEQPVFYTTNDGASYVVDQPGRIWAVVGDGDPEVFLDLRDRVTFGGEQGLLGLAFHPRYPGVFYVDYTGRDGATFVSEFTVDGPAADPGSERVVLEIPQPAGNHNGGMIAFGPEGDLWIGTGDGGGGDDQYGNGQRGDTLLGAMLRIRVGPEIVPYGTVEGLGFAAPEIWAIGLRNPWRFSFDGDRIWIGDVGQGEIEEIDVASVDERMLNFGWSIYEGSDCFAGPCEEDGLAFPVHEYRHDEGCSITGGYVYRGTAIPQLDGHYFFSDFCTGFIRSLAPDGTVHDWTEGTGTLGQPTSFGIDGAGEVYVVSAVGTVFRIVEKFE